MKSEWVNRNKIGGIKSPCLTRMFKFLPGMAPIPIKVLLVPFATAYD
jgi:hypothetical protein